MIRRSKLSIAALFALVALAAWHATAGSTHGDDGHGRTFAVRAKQIVTMDPKLGTIDNATMLVVDGKIQAVGTSIDVPAGVTVIDRRDAVLVPGLVSADSTMSRGGRRDEAVAPHHLAIDGYDPFANYAEALADGVTTAFLGTGSDRLVSGQGAVVKLAGGEVLARRSHLVVNFGDAALRTPTLQEVPIPSSSDVPIEPAEWQRPRSRMSQTAELAAQFADARAWAEARRSDDRPAFDARRDALARAMQLPVRVRAEHSADILQALRHRSMFETPISITGATEAHEVASELAASGVPVIVEIPFRFDRPGNDRGLAVDKLDETLRTAATLERHGVKFAISANAQARPGDLMMAAIAAVRGGLSPDRALAAVTRDAAELIGVGNRVGSLAPGKDADFLVLNGAPLRTTSRVLEVFVGGGHAWSMEHDSSTLVVRAGTIFTGEDTFDDGAVLIEGGKIRAVGRTVPVPRGARVIDAGPDAFVTPGFIDSHSHLGFEGDRTPTEPSLSLELLVAHEKRNFRDVAAAGVTTALVTSYGANRGGSRVMAMKTTGASRDELIVDETAGIFFSLRGSDPWTATRNIEGVLKRGQAYIDKWKKYDDDLAKWKEEQKKKESDAKAAAKKQKEDAKKAEQEKKDDSGEGEQAEEEEEKVDPISGTWSVTLSGGPMPEPTSGDMKLKLEGTTVTGSLVSPIGGDAQLTGTFTNNTLEAEVDVETPFGPPILTATIERPDYMKGSFAIGDVFSLDLEANRTEKSVPEIKIKRKKKSDDGRPLPPPVDESLEPVRALLEGKIPALIDTRTVAETDAALKLLRDEFKVPVVLLNAENASRIADRIAKSEAGVVVPSDILQRGEDRALHVPANTYARAGVPVAFQSGAEDAARTLPLQVAYAVYQGLDAHTALEALTINPARMFKIDDRVGMLAPGRDGDLLIFSGPPFEAASRLERTIISGKEVENR